MRVRDVDPKIKRLFPWGLFLFFALLFSLGAISLAHSQPAGVTCEDVIRRVGLKPLWVAEKIARRDHPDLTEADIAWGRQCVIDHRKAMLQSVEAKVKGAF